MGEKMQCYHEDHIVLKERGRQVTAKCNICGEVFSYMKEKNIPVPIVINRHEKSEKSNILLEKDRIIIINEVLTVDNEDVEVRSIEVGNKRVLKEKAMNITSIWAVSLTYPHVAGVSIHYPHHTKSYKVVLENDVIYGVGSVLQLGVQTFEITTLITERGRRKSGYGDEIKRIYGRPTKRIASSVLEAYDGDGQ